MKSLKPPKLDDRVRQMEELLKKQDEVKVLKPAPVKQYSIRL